MKTEIQTGNNSGYQWMGNSGIFVRGYFFVEGTMYSGTKAIDWLSKISDYDSFYECLPRLNGSFLIIIQHEDETWAAVDRARSMPLFYAKDGSIVSDCSETIRIKLGIDPSDVDHSQLAFFAVGGFTLLDHTMYTQIRQLNMAQVLRINQGQVVAVNYYCHVTVPVPTTYEAATASFTQVLDNVFDRLVKAIDNRTVLLSLSGGYDSRLVACMLKAKGVENVVCYTYGAEHSFDVKISKKVAEQLGYPLHYVEHTKEAILSVYSKQEEAYFNALISHEYTYYLQNYLALRELKKRGVIKSNMVAVTGMCGDLHSGAYVKEPYAITDDLLNEGAIADEYLNKVFRSCKVSPQIFQQLKREIVHYIKSLQLPITNKQAYVTCKDAFEGNCEHTRCFAEANRTHEFFDLEWLLPLWDNDFIEFWYSMPMELRLHQQMYEDYIVTVLGEKYDISFKKADYMDVVTIPQKEWLRKLRNQLGGILSITFLRIGIPFVRRIEVNGFCHATALLYKNLSFKKAVIPARSNHVHLLALNVIEGRYGVDVMKCLHSVLKK